MKEVEEFVQIFNDWVSEQSEKEVPVAETEEPAAQVILSKNLSTKQLESAQIQT